MLYCTQGSPSEDTRRDIKTSVVVMTGYSWLHVGGGQECCSTHHSAQDSLTENNPATVSPECKDVLWGITPALM